MHAHKGNHACRKEQVLPTARAAYWLKVDRKLREAAGAEADDVVTLEIAPVAQEPEPKVPADLLPHS